MASDKIRELEDNLIFKQMTTAAADKTAVDFLSKPDRMTSKDVHNMLMAAGFTPGLGNVADAADALLYAAEGEFGAAGLSMAAMIPFIGQAVSAKKAVRAAKEAGQEVVTLYRGTNWHPAKIRTEKGITTTGESMIRDGKFVGSRYSQFNPVTNRYDLPEGTIWTSNSIEEAVHWGISEGSDVFSGIKGKGMHLMKFEIPKKELNKLKPVSHKAGMILEDKSVTENFGIPGGIPKKWLTKTSELTEDMIMDIQHHGRYSLSGK